MEKVEKFGILEKDIEYLSERLDLMLIEKKLNNPKQLLIAWNFILYYFIICEF